MGFSKEDRQSFGKFLSRIREDAPDVIGLGIAVVPAGLVVYPFHHWLGGLLIAFPVITLSFIYLEFSKSDRKSEYSEIEGYLTAIVLFDVLKKSVSQFRNRVKDRTYL